MLPSKRGHQVKLENESLKYEISDLRKVIEKWTCSKVTLDQLLSEQVPGNVVQALGGKGRRGVKGPYKEVIFTKADNTLDPASMVSSDTESDVEHQIPLSPLPKLIGASPTGTSDSLMSLTDLTINMADLSLNSSVLKKNRSSGKCHPNLSLRKRPSLQLYLNHPLIRK